MHDAVLGLRLPSFRRDRPQGLAAIVLAVWVFQLLVSPIWLKYFRFGPAEWLWRSLTYWRIQPILARAGEAEPVVA